MKTSDHGIGLIKHFEGYRRDVYLDKAGKETIGYGHLLTEYERETGHFDDGISEDEAVSLLGLDLLSAEIDVEQTVKVHLNQNQFDALVSFTFNLGEVNLRKSTLLHRLNQGDYVGAAQAFAPWNKIRSPITGQLETSTNLIYRRATETALFQETEDLCSL